MHFLVVVIVDILLMLVCTQAQFLSYNPEDYLEVYPDPRDPDVLKGRTPLYFALIQSLGGPQGESDFSGTVAGVKIALDRINENKSLLPGYTLHYTLGNSQVMLYCWDTVSYLILPPCLFLMWCCNLLL